MDSPQKVLRAHGLSPKKSFGQNFLIEASIAERIADATGRDGTVLEIGAGLGALTEPLLARAAKVIAIERDRDLVPLLRERFADNPRFELHEADAVQLDWWQQLQRGPEPRVIAGNLPYQLTGRLIERSIALGARIDRVVVMVQREVAERLRAGHGGRDYGVLSVFAQAAFSIERLVRVPAGCFWPAPNVASEVVVMVPHNPPRAQETELFRKVVKLGFAQRRKKLRNAWSKLGAADLEAAAERAGIDLMARAETLTVEQFAAMAAAVAD